MSNYTASVHLLNVTPGDSTLIRHADGKWTMIDICDGNYEQPEASIFDLAPSIAKSKFKMTEYPTNPVSYLKNQNVSTLFRFILSHPDMDHLDGFNSLIDEISVLNFWDSGIRRKKPDFGDSSFSYKEDDWDRYEKVRDGHEAGVSTAIRKEGSRFAFANQNEDGESGGNGLHILSPTDQLVKDANESEDFNDASYVILYSSAGGKILLPGDAHDASWEHLIKNKLSEIQNCSFLLAPHHGRDSSRDYAFLDHIKPKLTLIGCSELGHVDLSQWDNRNLTYITSDQAGNVVLEITQGKIDVFVENDVFAKQNQSLYQNRNEQGYYYLMSLADQNNQQFDVAV